MTSRTAVMRRTAQRVVKPLLLLAAMWHITPCVIGSLLAVGVPDLWGKVVPLLLRTAALWLLWWLIDDPDTAAVSQPRRAGAR